MKYKLQQETKPRLSTFGKYKAVAVHQQTVGTKDITKECVEDKLPLLNEVIYKTALSRLSEVIKRHLRNGDKVCLEGIGMLKLEIESDKVDSPSDFKPKKHIRGVRLHIIPESIDDPRCPPPHHPREHRRRPGSLRRHRLQTRRMIKSIYQYTLSFPSDSRSHPFRAVP